MSTTYKSLLRKANQQIVELEATIEQLEPPVARLPLVTFYYPRHGRGGMTQRTVQVTEMNETHLRGLEMDYDNHPDGAGKPKTYLIEKISGGGKVLLLSV